MAQRNFFYPKSSVDSRQNDNANNADENEQDVSVRNFFNSNPSEDVQHDGVAGNAGADDNDEESLQELNVREVSPPDIEVTYGDVNEVVEVAGRMREYLRDVVQRLRSEISGEAFKNVNDQWLLRILQGNDWWLKASSHSRLICKKLQLILHSASWPTSSRHARLKERAELRLQVLRV